MSKCRDQPRIGVSNAFKANTRGAKKIRIPKKKKIPVVDVFDSRKQTHIMVQGQWFLTSYDKSVCSNA